MMMGTSGQQHWELIRKIDPNEADGIDVDTVEAFLDHTKVDFEHLDMDTRIVTDDSFEAVVEAQAMTNMSVAGGNGGGGGGGGGGTGAATNGAGAGVSGGGALNAAMYPGAAMFYEGHAQMPPSPLDQKSQIRHDCMWAGMCDDQYHPEKSGGCSRCAQQQPHYRHPVYRYIHHILSQPEEAQGPTTGKVPTAQRPSFSTLTRVFGTTTTTTTNANQFRPSPTSLLAPFKATQSAAEIPAGGSLLKRQQLQQQQQQQQQQQPSTASTNHIRQLPTTPPSSDYYSQSSDCSSSSSSSSAAGGGADGAQSVGVTTLRVPYLARGAFLADKERQVLASCASQQHHARPDTPLSLDDDAPEFKHNLDLVATCTIGSNQQSLLQQQQQQQQHPSTSASAGESRHAGGGSIAAGASPSPPVSGSTSSSSSSGIGSGISSPSSSSSSTRSDSSTATSIPSLQYYYNYLQDTTYPMKDFERVNLLRQQLLMLDDDDHYHMRADSPDNALTQLLCDLRDIEMKDSEESVRGNLFGTGDCTSSLLAGSGGSLEGHANGVSSGTGTAASSSALGLGGVNLNGGLYQHRIAQRASVGTGSSLHQSDLHHHHHHHHHHHQQHANGTCRCEQLPHLRGCSMFHHGGVGVRQPLASRKRPYTWIDCAYDDEAFDDGDAEEDVVKQLEQEDDDDELLFGGSNGVELEPSSSCSSEEEDDDDEEEEEEEEEDEEEEEEDEEDTCSVSSSSAGSERRRCVGRRTRRPMQSYQHPASAVRSRSHHRQHQRRRAALVVPASRPYDASATSKSRKSKQQQQQKPPKKQLGAEVSYIATEVHVTTAPSSPNSATDHHLGAAIAPTHPECHQATHVGDHSYTRPKGRYIMNELGVQTPSDSEEEIDVVSIGDKNLPTNPTARNRRHLESEVASKIRTASSRPPNGALHYDRHGGGSYHHHHHHHPHHRQQTSHDDVVAGRGVGAPLLGGMYPTPAGSTTISGANTPLPTGSGCHSAASSPPPPHAAASSMSRRRTHGASAGGSNKRGSSGAAGGPSSKRMRQHHSKRSGNNNGHEGRSGSDSAAGGPHDELDTVEKRNLHNNMERQRRIGLKNLFEELKRQIPNLRDKDRAPKVNILREAAALCNRLNRESDQIAELRQHQKKLYERVRFLRSTMHTQRAQHAAIPVAE